MTLLFNVEGKDVFILSLSDQGVENILKIKGFGEFLQSLSCCPMIGLFADIMPTSQTSKGFYT
jgi:hypothetical protein